MCREIERKRIRKKDKKDCEGRGKRREGQEWERRPKMEEKRGLIREEQGKGKEKEEGRG